MPMWCIRKSLSDVVRGDLVPVFFQSDRKKTIHGEGKCELRKNSEDKNYDTWEAQTI